MIFPKNPNPGLFIAVEGLDGSGSSTQIELLERKLKKTGKKPYVTKEPTENEIGKLIRKVLTKKLKVPADALQLLFTADRSLHLQKEINPHLKSGDTVITERYFWSTIAYGSLDVKMEHLIDLNKNFIQPDITFFLDVAPRVCIDRIKKSRSSLEHFETLEKLTEIKKYYQKLISKFSQNFKVINGEETVGVVGKAIFQEITKKNLIV